MSEMTSEGEALRRQRDGRPPHPDRAAAEEDRGALAKTASLLERVSLAVCLLAGAGYGLMMLMVTVAVVFRYALNSPLTFAPETSGYIVTFGVFMGLGYTFRTGGHIATDILVARMSARVVAVLEVAAGVIAFVWSTAVLAAVWERTLGYYRAGTSSMASLEIPLWIPASAMVAGAALLCVEVIAWTLRVPQRLAERRAGAS